MDQDAAWYEGGPDDIVLDGDSAFSTERSIAALIFRAMPIAVKRSPISATAERCYIYACLLLDRIAHITYVDAVYCYRPNSVICHTGEPWKNG